MGSKNRKYLGIVNNLIMHNIRNAFFKKLYMTDSTIKKIEDKHPPLDKEFILNDNFQIVVDNTIMIYFDEKKKTYNCLSKINDDFLRYGLVPKNNITEVTTLFKTNPKQIKKDFLENEKTIEIQKVEFRTN